VKERFDETDDGSEARCSKIHSRSLACIKRSLRSSPGRFFLAHASSASFCNFDGKLLGRSFCDHTYIQLKWHSICFVDSVVFCFLVFAQQASKPLRVSAPLTVSCARAQRGGLPTGWEFWVTIRTTGFDSLPVRLFSGIQTTPVLVCKDRCKRIRASPCVHIRPCPGLSS
jgi:hypothetical protein